MGGGAEDERQTRVDPSLEPVLGHRRLEMTSLPIPDELTVNIFLRLPNPADLVRASAACVSFRHLIADRSFLRRFRKLHAPPLLGFLEQERKVFHPVASPHPSAPEASAAALAADFSFSFLPAPATDWLVQDIRDGRVLLDRPPEHDIHGYKVLSPELVVCDPLHRRYILLPPIPAHLATTMELPLWRSCCDTFLAPPGDDEDEASAAEETSFSVIWMSFCRTKLVAFVFSSSTGQWRAISSQSWSDLSAGLLSSTEIPIFLRRKYAYGCFYWLDDLGGKLLVLDTRRMEFFISETPLEATGWLGESIAIVEAGEGMPGMFVLSESGNHLNYNIWRNNGGSSSQWHFEKTVSLDSEYWFMGSTGRHLFLLKRENSPYDPCLVSLDVKTFHLERVFVSNLPMVHSTRCTYSNFPPSLLSTPTISSGVEKGADELLEQAVLQAQAHIHHGRNSAEENAGGLAVLRD